MNIAFSKYMSPYSKGCIFMATFCCGLVLYFALPLFSFGQHPINLNIFESPTANFIFMLACIVGIAYIFSETAHALLCRYRKAHQRSIGEILKILDLVDPEDHDGS